MVLRLGRTREAVGEYQDVAAAWARQGILRQAIAVCRLILQRRGRCAVFHQHLDGHETHYPELREGAVFGEVSPLRSKLVTASVRTQTPCLLLRLERSRFERFLGTSPEQNRAVTRICAERLARTARPLTERRHARATRALAASDKPPCEATLRP